MPASIEYVLGIILKKQIDMKSNEIAKRAEKIVDDHFETQPKKTLDANQINRFTGIARSSNQPKQVQEFIQKQSKKERKEWIENELNKRLLDVIKIIEEDDAKQVYQDAFTIAKKYLEVDAANTFDKDNRKEYIHNTALALLRQFVIHFGIYYLYRGEGNV